MKSSVDASPAAGSGHALPFLGPLTSARAWKADNSALPRQDEGPELEPLGQTCSH